jgi:hypothetical protein
MLHSHMSHCIVVYSIIIVVSSGIWHIAHHKKLNLTIYTIRYQQANWYWHACIIIVYISSNLMSRRVWSHHFLQSTQYPSSFQYRKVHHHRLDLGFEQSTVVMYTSNRLVLSLYYCIFAFVSFSSSCFWFIYSSYENSSQTTVATVKSLIT